MNLSKTAEALQESFTHWLQLLGYQSSSVYNLKNYLQALLQYLEKQGLLLNGASVESYITYVQQRPKKTKSKGHLSAMSLSRIYQMLRLLQEYYLLSKGELLAVTIPKLKRVSIPRDALTKEQIRLIYEAIEEEPKEALRLRDRAIIAVLYGCGLRRGEAQNVAIKDLLFRQGLLYVAPAKNGQGRYVPMMESVMEVLKDYIFSGRYVADPAHQGKLFISQVGKSLCKAQYQVRVLKWKQAAGIKTIITPHIFRHSIATHLLEEGMSIEQISQFLGHRSLAATQIYTHVKPRIK